MPLTSPSPALHGVQNAPRKLSPIEPLIPDSRPTHSGLLVRIRGPDCRSAGTGSGAARVGHDLWRAAPLGDSEPRPSSTPLFTSEDHRGRLCPPQSGAAADDLSCPLTNGHRKRHHSFESYNSPYSHFTDKDTGIYKEKKGR